MPLSDPRLYELASLFGISTEFWDWKGRRTEVSDEAVIAVLKAMDVDVVDPDARQPAIDEFHTRVWRRALPPCVVVEQGQEYIVNVHVPAGQSCRVHVRLENGGRVDAWQVDNFNPDREVDGAMRGEASFSLPTSVALGYHRMVMKTGDQTSEGSFIVTPAWLGFPERMGDRTIWGYATQLYSVHGRASWNFGDLVDLADLSVWSATQQFSNYVLINPLHAAQPVAPMDPSPYLPSSRRYVNPIYIRPEVIPEFSGLRRRYRRRVIDIHEDLSRRLESATSIKRDDVWAAKRRALQIIYDGGRSMARQMAFEDFVRREGRQLRDFATWCALSEVYGPNWRDWPERFHRPTAPDVQAFAVEHEEVVGFFEWLQWIADNQLSNAQQAAVDAGMAVGIVSDLAVGVSSQSAEVWAMGPVFAQGVTVGAPPDPYNQSGQDWGQPPWRPDRLADLSYAPFRAMVSGIMRHSGGIRVDHIIGLFRLWWVPQGRGPKQGAYVRYDHQALVGILALEAHRAQALVIGEDLGTVEPWVRDYLRRRGILGTSVLWFEYGPDGRPLPPERWREYCMASVTTHDLPPTAGYLAHDHVALRHSLGLLTEPLDEEIALDSAEQSAVLQMLEDRGALAPGERDVEQVLLALHRFLTWTPSRVLCATLTDAVGDRRTQNQPGTVDEYPNWRVPLSDRSGHRLLLEDVFASESALRLSAVMNRFAGVPEMRGARRLEVNQPHLEA